MVLYSICSFNIDDVRVFFMPGTISSLIGTFSWILGTNQNWLHVFHIFSYGLCSGMMGTVFLGAVSSVLGRR